MKNNKMRSSYRLIPFLFVVVGSCITIGCDDDDGGGPAGATIKVKLSSNVSMGEYLSDADGNALYFFSNDAGGQNTCSGGCAANWPVYHAGALTEDNLGDDLSIDDFGTVTTSGGSSQTTYKGWPLYYYAPGGTREATGQTTGEGVGGIWFLAKTDYTVMIANAQLVGMDGKNYKGDYTEGDQMVKYFTDDEGRTIYAFKNDKRNDNNWNTGDEAHDSTWPIYEKDVESVPSILDKNLFGSINVMGKDQLTYKGWPLYYFKNDAVRGDNKGVSVPTPGVWPVVVADIEEAPE